MIKINIKNISNNEIKNELKSLKNSHNKANYFWDTQSEKIISEFINKDPKQFLISVLQIHIIRIYFLLSLN